MTHAGGGGAHEDFVILRIIYIDLFDGQRLIGTMKYGGLHRDVAPFRDARKISA